MADAGDPNLSLTPLAVVGASWALREPEIWQHLRQHVLPGVLFNTLLLFIIIIGLLLLTASYVAVGLYVSALTTQPVIAAIGALAVLVGLWLADMWINAGREEPVHYVELGPGRGPRGVLHRLADQRRRDP